MTHNVNHLAIIMDGNGRWAKERMLPRFLGHRKGAKVIRDVVVFCIKEKISVLSLFALSIENILHRPEKEVSLLYSLFSDSIDRNIDELDKEGVRLRIIGDLSVVPEALQEKAGRAIDRLAHNDKLELVLAINYSGRWDITQACRRLMDAMPESPEAIDEAAFSSYLSMADLIEPDLLIRTGGEHRISNFFLWQAAYTELLFLPQYWPDINQAILQDALSRFGARERRFGKTSEQVAAIEN